MFGASVGMAAFLAAFPVFSADGFRLAPYKDELFRYPEIVGEAFEGAYIKVAFDHRRDVIDRDIVPDEKTRPDYVSLEVKSTEADLVLRSGDATVNYVGVGRTSGNASIVTIFIHGWQATRFDGVNDWRSGGNLNRIKNLMVRNGGVYLSPDFSALKGRAVRQVKALMEAFAANSPGAPMILVCASLGARNCWEIVRDPEAAGRLAGILFVAGLADEGFLTAPMMKGGAKPVPIYMGHGTGDRSVSFRAQEALFRRIKAAAPDYPIRFVAFDTGTHRAPLRMTDWRLAINWMLEVGGW